MSGAEEWSRWRATRDEAVLRPLGIASLDRTEWPDEHEREFDGLPGRWRVSGGEIVGETTGGDVVRLADGDFADVGALRVQHVARDGSSRLRVFDPRSVHRTSIDEIETFPYDDAWVVSGTFSAARQGERIEIGTADGGRRDTGLAGTAVLDTPGGPVELTVTRGVGTALSAVVTDASTFSGTYRFRFLEIGEPVRGRITVDFNRAHLPPCAFAPDYVCPLPPPGNRWDVVVEAGERRVRRTTDEA